MMVISVIGITYDLQVDNTLSNAYASSYQNTGSSDSVSLITLSIQNLANEKYNEGYLAGYQALNSHYTNNNQLQEESKSLDIGTGIIENYYYPNYNNPDFDDSDLGSGAFW